MVGPETVEYGTVRYGTFIRYGTVRFGTVRYGQGDKFGGTTVLFITFQQFLIFFLKLQNNTKLIFISKNFTKFVIKNQHNNNTTKVFFLPII